MKTSLHTFKNRLQLFLMITLMSGSIAFSQQITDVTPNKAKLGTTLDVVISGDLTHFGQGTSVLETSVWFSQATSTASPLVIFPNSVNIESGTRMTANFSIALGYPRGDYHVNTYNSVDGLITDINGFNINTNPVGLEAFRDQFQLEVYPNPVVDRFSVQLNLPAVSDITMQLFDINGKELMQRQLTNVSKGQHITDFDLSKGGISSGTYYLKLQVNEASYVQPIIKN